MFLLFQGKNGRTLFQSSKFMSIGSPTEKEASSFLILLQSKRPVTLIRSGFQDVYISKGPPPLPPQGICATKPLGGLWEAPFFILLGRSNLLCHLLQSIIHKDSEWCLNCSALKGRNGGYRWVMVFRF